MKTRLTAIVGALSLAAALSLTVTGSAFAAGTTDQGPAGTGACASLKAATTVTASPSKDGALLLQAIKSFGNCEINRRFATLTDLSNRVSASKVLTSGDASALKTIIDNTTAGLTSLKTQLDGETTIAAARQDVVNIAVQYRVYLLVVPQVHLTNASDGVLAAQTKFADINTALSNAIAAAKAAGKDTTTAQQDLDAMNASVTAAVNLAQPLPAALLALTPAQYNAGPGATTVKNARAALLQARDDLMAAVNSAEACRNALK